MSSVNFELQIEGKIKQLLENGWDSLDTPPTTKGAEEIGMNEKPSDTLYLQYRTYPKDAFKNYKTIYAVHTSSSD